MTELCEILREKTGYVYKWLKAQPDVKEESLTDWLLFSLSDAASNIYYRSFTRHEEARTTGADWEWWFLFPDGNICLRVQAKKLNSQKDNYPTLVYANAYGLQIDKLIKDSIAANAIPMYAFFSTSDTKSLCRLKYDTHAGVYLASAFRVYSDFIKVRKRVTVKDAQSKTTPLSCLSCCPISCTSGARGLYGHLEKYHDVTKNLNMEDLVSGHTNDEHLRGNRNLGFHQSFPPYISSMLEPSDLPPSENQKHNHIASFPDVGGVLIFDERETF